MTVDQKGSGADKLIKTHISTNRCSHQHTLKLLWQIYWVFTSRLTKTLLRVLLVMKAWY